MARPAGNDAFGSSDDGLTARDLAMVLQVLTGRPVDAAEQSAGESDSKPVIVRSLLGASALPSLLTGGRRRNH